MKCINCDDKLNEQQKTIKTPCCDKDLCLDCLELTDENEGFVCSNCGEFVVGANNDDGEHYLYIDFRSPKLIEALKTALKNEYPNMKGKIVHFNYDEEMEYTRTDESTDSEEEHEAANLPQGFWIQSWVLVPYSKLPKKYHQ